MQEIHVGGIIKGRAADERGVQIPRYGMHPARAGGGEARSEVIIDCRVPESVLLIA
jgi:hypothetical protein